MLTKKEKSLLWIILILVSINVIILSIITIIDWSYLTGFLVGLFISVYSILFNVFFIGKLLSKRRSKKMGFVISIFKFVLWMLITGSILVGILFANYFYNNKTNDAMSWIAGIFNLFFVIYGSIIVSLSIIINTIWETIHNRKIKGGISGQ